MQALGVVAKWGSQIGGWHRTAPMDSEPKVGRPYEIKFTMESTPREPTAAECYATFGEFVHQWHIGHPEYDIKYIEVSRSSPQRLKIQFVPIRESSSSLIGTIAALIAYAFAMAVIAAIVYLTITVTPEAADAIITGAEALGEGLKWVAFAFCGFAVVWGASKVYPAVKGKS